METVAIFGCPRSGTSWLGQIFNAHPAVQYRYQPLFSYEFKNWFDRHGLTEASLARFHTELAGAQSEFVLQALRPAKRTPTHLVWKEVRHHGCMGPLLAVPGLRRLVYLFRPPVDVINSWFLAPKEFRAGWDIHREWLDAPSKNLDPSEFNGFARWKQSLRLALDLQASHPDRLLLLSYERLRREPLAQVTALLHDCGLAPSPEVAAFLTESTQRHDAADAYSVFRAERAALALPPDIVQAIQADDEAHALLARAESLSLRS